MEFLLWHALAMTSVVAVSFCMGYCTHKLVSTQRDS